MGSRWRSGSIFDRIEIHAEWKDVELLMLE